MEGVLTAKIKQATVLWFEGFREACCLHRVLVFCLRSRKLLIRTGQCFLLNGLIFLGSIFVLKSVVIPTLQWILPDQWPQISSQESYSCGGILKFYSFLHVGLVQLFYIFWFYPLYIFSFILSNIWYIDIAKYGFVAMGKFGPSMAETVGRKESLNTQRIAHVVKPAGLGGVIFGMAEQVYSVLLLSFFFVEVYATGFIPYIGKALNFLLLSWMYAYYCFEYKWNLTEMGLDRRLDFFESNWSFFLGFGNPCVLAIFFFSPLVSYGVMAMLFPLQQALRLKTLLLLKEENVKVLNWAGFQYFMQPILYRCGSCLSSPWNLKIGSRIIRISEESCHILP
ncbi:protein EI24 homolog isoform X2 [Malania oleifera]|uniref:protein EI24 homolog isoform X2 n=1 Tax=Malania oleifera TaxID=397392 RepID=UPI0025AE4881|nr:protein EI24 homolog isoform X2 [Malania oleifera]XP_057978014.1 protein EI24 homolog isoform X2 [Malania oleifera]